MAPFSVIVFGVVMWTIAVSGAEKAPFSFENRLVWTGPRFSGDNILSGTKMSEIKVP